MYTNSQKLFCNANFQTVRLVYVPGRYKWQVCSKVKSAMYFSIANSCCTELGIQTVCLYMCPLRCTVQLAEQSTKVMQDRGMLTCFSRASSPLNGKLPLQPVAVLFLPSQFSFLQMQCIKMPQHLAAGDPELLLTLTKYLSFMFVSTTHSLSVSCGDSWRCSTVVLKMYIWTWQRHA